MKKDSAVIFSLSLLLTAAIIGGAYYMAVVRQPPETARETIWQTLEPGGTQPRGDVRTAPTPSDRSANTPIRCHDSEIGEFWTNAASCDEADLHNRLSYAETYTTPSQQQPYGNEKYVSPEEAAERSFGKTRSSSRATGKPGLRLTGRSPPSNLSTECKFPVGKALELERPLSAADDPRESIWREDYCQWLDEVRDKRCDVPADLFYYGALCPRAFGSR